MKVTVKSVTVKSIRRKLYRIVLCHIAGSMGLASVFASAQPPGLFGLVGWRGEGRAMSLESGERIPDERSVRRGNAPVEYQPRERRERMSPEDRIQLRRDVRDAGRDIYPEERRGRHHGGRGGERN